VVITGAHSQADVRALSVALPPALGLAGRRPTLQLAVTQARSGVVTVSLSGRGAGSATVTLRRRLHRLAAAPAELRRRPRLAFSPEATAADGYRSAERSERG